jgi:hypothetical protein
VVGLERRRGVGMMKMGFVTANDPTVEVSLCRAGTAGGVEVPMTGREEATSAIWDKTVNSCCWGVLVGGARVEW